MASALRRPELIVKKRVKGILEKTGLLLVIPAKAGIHGLCISWINVHGLTGCTVVEHFRLRGHDEDFFEMLEVSS